MTKVNFTACFDATFEYDENMKLRVSGNEFEKLDEEGNRIPALDKNGNEKKDKEGNTIYLTYKKSAKEILDEEIKNDITLGQASFIESNIEHDSDTVYEYEVNLFDFIEDYETIETAADALISKLYAKYTNIRAYTVGKYTGGNSFGIKIVIVIF